MKKIYMTVLVLFLTMAAAAASAGNAPAKTSFQLPAYEKVVLENGLTVYLMEQHEVPLIYLSMVVPAGAEKDGSQYGLASLTADALLFGTKTYTKEQIEEKLDFLGADYGTGANAEVARITASFARKDLDTVLPIFKEVISAPVFNQEEFEKRKKRLLVELEQDKERPSAVISSYFNKFVFSGHGYGNPVSGTRGTVTGITVEDVKKFYAANYKPCQSALAVVGDFDTAQMKDDIKKLLAITPLQKTL